MSDNVKERWFKPVNRLGRLTLIFAMIASFFPFLYLYISYGELPEGSVIAQGIGLTFSAYLAAYIVEPVSYFPALGTAGTYMGILAGSIGQMRVPSSLVAKSTLGVEENTQEAEIVGTCGIAGSIYMNIIVLTLTAIGGSVIIAVLPEVVLGAMSAYILPAIFGAVLAMFTTKGKMQITIPVFAFAILCNWLNSRGMWPLPAWSLLPLMVVTGVVVARVLYKKGWAY